MPGAFDQTWATGGTYSHTLPSTGTMYSFTVECIAGGGSGGAVNLTSKRAGGGAGGGCSVYAVEGPGCYAMGTTFTIVVGSGGNFKSVNGDNSSVYDSTNSTMICLSNGGGGVPLNSGDRGLAINRGAIGTDKWSGGNGAISGTSWSGGGGGGAGTTADGTSASGISGGAGGAKGGGTGGNGRSAPLSPGTGYPGANYGAGGGGAVDNSPSSGYNGGNGAVGAIRIAYSWTNASNNNQMYNIISTF